jgi:hypothetical protein
MYSLLFYLLYNILLFGSSNNAFIFSLTGDFNMNKRIVKIKIKKISFLNLFRDFS